MARAIQLAARGRGLVEPNPMVGCVMVQPGADPTGPATPIAEGWHQRFGGPHAEIMALRAAGPRAAGATMYVSLEPCCHHGKTPPCTQAVIDARVARVVIGHQDPFAQVAGKGIDCLRQAGLTVEVGVLGREARQLNAAYCKLLGTGRPWIIAKWAMTLDGKLATRTGHSQWISAPASRKIVHEIRGRVDGILVGRGTAQADDPQLTARPPGPRVATRIVADSQAALDSHSRLARTAGDVPILVAVSATAAENDRQRLLAAGCQVLVCPGRTHAQRLDFLLDHLGQQRMTNVLVEGGSRLLGSLWDAHQIDEVHVFIAPKLVGGAAALSPLAGHGLARIPDHASLSDVVIEPLDHDIYVRGRVVHPTR